MTTIGGAGKSSQVSVVRTGLDKRGRKTDQPIPLDLMSTRFLGKMFLVVPLLAALAAHLAEPGLLTTDKAKKNQ